MCKDSSTDDFQRGNILQNITIHAQKGENM